MIINTSQGDLEVIGDDIKEFKSSIDPKNLEFITTLLSSNLYSNPERSFIREIVSNAWDSHVEAKTTDIPVIIKFTSDSVTIRDYGTGLSPERFNEVYRNIGSSTKRESNDYHGAFGIGHLSPFACSSTVYITSYYNGKAYHYIGSKVNNTIAYHQVNICDTTEKNGVEITLKNVTNIPLYHEGLENILFFPNVYVDNSYKNNSTFYTRSFENFNNVKVKRFKYFAAASKSCVHKLLLGNVLYPLDDTKVISDNNKSFIRRIQATGIVIKFDIGELSITPNRESIIYTEKTTKLINDRIKEAQEELDSLASKHFQKDYDNIFDYTESISYTHYYEPVSDTVDNEKYIAYPLNLEESDKVNVTYKGKDLKQYNDILRAYYYLVLPNIRGLIVDSKIYSKTIPTMYSRYTRFNSKKILIVDNSNFRFTATIKEYLKDKYNGYVILNPFSKEQLKEYVGENIKFRYTNYDKILDYIYESITAECIHINFETDKDFLKYKEERKETNKTKEKKPESVILHIYRSSGFKNKEYFSSVDEAIKHIKSRKKGIVLLNMDVDDFLISRIVEVKKDYMFIKTRKDVISYIKGLNLKCVIDFDWIIKKDPVLSVMKTIKEHFPEGLSMYSDAINCILRNIEPTIGSELRKMIDIYNKYISPYRSIYDRDYISNDAYTDYLCTKLKHYLVKQLYVNNIIADSTKYGYISNIDTALIIKTKAYRISPAVYSKYKNSKLFNILCKK